VGCILVPLRRWFCGIAETCGKQHMKSRSIGRGKTTALKYRADTKRLTEWIDLSPGAFLCAHFEINATSRKAGLL